MKWEKTPFTIAKGFFKSKKTLEIYKNTILKYS